MLLLRAGLIVQILLQHALLLLLLHLHLILHALLAGHHGLLDRAEDAKADIAKAIALEKNRR